MKHQINAQAFEITRKTHSNSLIKGGWFLYFLYTEIKLLQIALNDRFFSSTNYGEKIMNSNTKIIIAAITTALSAGIYTSAVSAASISANASANVIAPLTVTETNGGMNFGDVAVGTGGGTVVLDTTGGRSVTGDAEAVAGGTVQAGAYDVTGSGTKAYSISLPASTTISDGTNTMTVDGFTHDAGATPALTAGAGSFNVGATLNINGSQAANPYAGTYTLTVNYQ